MALDEKYTKGPFYLWSPVRDGGDVKMVPTALGQERAVVTSRNVTEVGSKVTQSGLSASDEQWVEWVDGGVVRPYPFPEGAKDSQDSPIVFLQKSLAETARSEEERLVAAVSAATTTEQGLVEANADAAKEEGKKA